VYRRNVIDLVYSIKTYVFPECTASLYNPNLPTEPVIDGNAVLEKILSGNYLVKELFSLRKVEQVSCI
jgi:hypothetical protein